MSSFGCFTFVLIALSCYALSSSKAVRIEHQATKKVDLPNRLSTPERYSPEHQISHSIKDTEARPKRSQRDMDLNGIIEDLEDNSIAQVVATGPQEFDFENMQPLTYYLILQKLKQLQSIEPKYRVRTPRLGRSIDFQLLDSAGIDGGEGGEDMISRVIKKSVPFKPRLGKRGQMCD